MTKQPLPPFPPEDLVEELRDQARRTTEDLNQGMPAAAIKIGIPVFTVEDTLEWEAADLIEDWHGKMKDAGLL